MRTKIIHSIFFSLLVMQVLSIDHPAKFIWKDSLGSGRQQVVLFRNSFHLNEIPTESALHIFADSRYHLYVNGMHLNFGPSRFYTEHPEYDTYKLESYLVNGKNVIAVEVLANGMESFQLPYSLGGFIAWGELITPDQTINFKTPGAWKMLPVASMDTNTVKFSFATGALEVQDLNQEPAGWTTASFNDSDWFPPVLINEQDHWGDLTCRSIPQLTQLEKTPIACLGIYRVQEKEHIYSCYIKTPDEKRKDYNAGQHLIGYSWIYSPIVQEIELGTWWGDYYLNGKGPVPVSSKDAYNPVRQNRLFRLNKGWNYLFIYYNAIWGAWEFTIAVPAHSGIVFSADKTREGTTLMKTLKASGKQEAEKWVDQFKSDEKALGKSLNSLDWQSHEDEARITNPARELVWNHSDPSKNLRINNFQTGAFKAEYPTDYLFDMGNKTLGSLFIDINAHQGTVIEMGWSEDLNEHNMPYLYKREQINSGCRFITDGITERYRTFKPYGVKYLLVRISPPETQSAILKQAGVIEQVYPYEKKGSFECSDPMLNRIWELGWRTLRVCSEDSYTDTPFRERGLYAGDALPEYAISLATTGDSRLMKKSLLLFQDMYHEEMTTGLVNKHNDFILKTLVELYWYYRHTGDSAFARHLYPNYRNYLDHLEKNRLPEGYYKAGQVFLEWTKIPKTADLTAYQALLYGSQRMMQELAGELGFEDDVHKFAERAEALKSALNKLFWDENKQAFFDGFENGQKINHHYPISSFYPLLFDAIEGDDRKEQVICFLDKELMDIGEESRNRKITPYASFYLFAALYQNGEAAIAERFMKQYWSRMIQNGDDTSWENFDIDPGTQGTASHAWSGHPTYFMSAEILGVKMGFNQGFSRDTILIQPQAENISWAKGVVPHPAGLVKVEWRIQGENLFFNLEIPADIPYVVEPRGKLAGLYLILNTSVVN